MMVLKNEAIKKLAFLEVLEYINSGNIATLERAGLSKEAIARLNLAAAKDVLTLARMINLEITFNPKTLNMDFSRSDLAQEESSALEYFVINHATSAMIRRFFKGVPDADIRSLRERFGVRKKGRSPTVDDKTASQVLDTWATLSRVIQDERQRYISLHEEFVEWPMSALYSAINETNGSSKTD